MTVIPAEEHRRKAQLRAGAMYNAPDRVLYRCLTIAEEALRNSPDGVEALEQIDMALGIN